MTSCSSTTLRFRNSCLDPHRDSELVSQQTQSPPSVRVIADRLLAHGSEGGRKRYFVGQRLWDWGGFVHTMGCDEATIRDYIRDQEQEDQRLAQMRLGEWSTTTEVAPVNRGRVSDLA